MRFTKWKSISTHDHHHHTSPSPSPSSFLMTTATDGMFLIGTVLELISRWLEVVSQFPASSPPFLPVSHLIPTMTLWGRYYDSLVLHKRKLKIRELKCLSQNHIGNKWESWGSGGHPLYNIVYLNYFICLTQRGLVRRICHESHILILSSSSYLLVPSYESIILYCPSSSVDPSRIYFKKLILFFVISPLVCLYF